MDCKYCNTPTAAGEIHPLFLKRVDRARSGLHSPEIILDPAGLADVCQPLVDALEVVLVLLGLVEDSRERKSKISAPNALLI